VQEPRGRNRVETWNGWRGENGAPDAVDVGVGETNGLKKKKTGGEVCSNGDLFWRGLERKVGASLKRFRLGLKEKNPRH